MRTPNFFPNPQQKLLLQTILDSCGSARQAALGWLAEVDFDSLDRGSQRLLPLLHARLSELGVEHALRGRIHGAFRRAWYLDKRIRHEFGKVHAAATEAGIECILLKGLSLGIEVYGSPALRPMDDIDLLVRSSDYPSMLAVIKRMGWAVDVPWALQIIEYVHSINLHRPNGPEIDLHTSPYPETSAPEDDLGIWRRRRLISFESSAFWALAPSDQLLHSLSHGQRVNAVEPIRWIADAVMLLRKYPDLDWDSLVSEAQRLQLSLAAWRGLAYLHSTFVQSIPVNVMDSLRQSSTVVERIEYRFERRSKDGPLVLWMRFRRMRRNLLARWMYLLEFYRISWRVKTRQRVLKLVAVRMLFGRAAWARLLRSKD